MVLTKVGNRWALVSKTDSKKILKWFGQRKPSADEVEAEERRVQFFKNRGEFIKKNQQVSVKKHRRSDGSIVKAHFRKVPKYKRRKLRTTRYNFS